MHTAGAPGKPHSGKTMAFGLACMKRCAFTAFADEESAMPSVAPAVCVLV